MNDSIVLSVIMPLFNVEKTLQVALDSIYIQEVDFKYEIIAINDASNDHTLEILKSNQLNHPELKIIEHDTNQGNAVSFYDGLCVSQGKYFCVLDGDDYYTVKYKLQKQVNFLNGDFEEDYVAVCHKWLMVDKEYNFIDSGIFNSITDIDYFTFLEHFPYNHTSTFMYRNIFKGRVPEFLKEEYCKGDNPRTILHLIYTKGKIKILDFIGSVYRYDNNGIWSKLSQKEQDQRNIFILQKIAEHFQTTIEKELILSIVNKIQHKPITSVPIQADCSVQYIKRATELANQYAFSKSDFSFKSLYTSMFIDSFAESLGYVEKIRRNITLSNPMRINENNILITISKLSTNGGGYSMKSMKSVKSTNLMQYTYYSQT